MAPGCLFSYRTLDPTLFLVRTRSEAAPVERYDVIVVGGGPAGLSAALMLGRCRRRVLVFDDNQPRNAVSHAAHGFFTRDGTPPAELRRIGREQLERYAIEVRKETVEDAWPAPEGFEVKLARGDVFACRKLLIATGLRDRIPKVEGLEGLYGRSVWTCPYCDGWEVQEQSLAAWAKGEEGVEFALALTTWSSDVVLLTDGQRRLSSSAMKALARHRIPWISDVIVRLEGENGQLERIFFRTGKCLLRRGLFLHLGAEQRSRLPARLGCEFTRNGAVKRTRKQETRISGLYMVGDASRDALFIVVAAAEGARAAVAINKALREERSARQPLLPREPRLEVQRL